MPYFENKIVTLNSRYASSALNGSLLSNLLFDFRGILRPEPNIRRAYISVLNAQFPVSFYVINSSNNSIIVMDNTSLRDFTITVLVGNYTATSLSQGIIAGFQSAGYPYVPGIDFNKNTGKYTFLFPSPATIFAESTMRDILGSGSESLSGTAIVLPYPVNLLGAKLLNVTSSALPVNSYSSASGSNTSILASIPVEPQPSVSSFTLLAVTC